MMILLPVGILYHLRVQPDGAPYRRVVTISALSFAAFTLLQQYRVDGMFCGMPRFLLCLPVLVVLWTAVPLLSWLRGRGRTILHGILSLSALAYFVGEHWEYLRKDETRSWDMVREMLDHPEQPLAGNVAVVFDRHAGPKDAVALDGGFGALFYPIYGTRCERPLYFLKPSPGSVAIPGQAKWVVIDHSWNAGWSHPGATSTADFLLPSKGIATKEDKAVFLQLSKDPSWQLMYLDPSRDEAVFLRKAMAAS